MNDNQAMGGGGYYMPRGILPPEKQTRDTEEKRPFRYAAFRVAIRSTMLGLVFAEIILIGPILPLWLAIAALVYAIDRIHFSIDTRDRPDIYVKFKDDLRHDRRFMGLTAITIFMEFLYQQGIWFPVWFPSYDGVLWWQTATSAGRILPFLGSFPVWFKLFIVAGIPIGLWDPLKILDWVFTVESVWTQYRNTPFSPAGPRACSPPWESCNHSPCPTNLSPRYR